MINYGGSVCWGLVCSSGVRGDWLGVIRGNE